MIMIYNFVTDLLKFFRLGKGNENKLILMFLVSHDIYCSYCPSPCFINWFPLTWDDSIISRNTETRNSFCLQFAEVFFMVCQFLG